MKSIIEEFAEFLGSLYDRHFKWVYYEINEEEHYVKYRIALGNYVIIPFRVFDEEMERRQKVFNEILKGQ